MEDKIFQTDTVIGSGNSLEAQILALCYWREVTPLAGGPREGVLAYCGEYSERVLGDSGLWVLLGSHERSSLFYCASTIRHTATGTISHEPRLPKL